MEQELTLHQAKMDLLRVVENLKTVDEVLAIRQIISEFYFKKVEEDMDALWECGEWNQEKIKALENAHLRTPYKYAR